MRRKHSRRQRNNSHVCLELTKGEECVFTVESMRTSHLTHVFQTGVRLKMLNKTRAVKIVSEKKK